MKKHFKEHIRKLSRYQTSLGRDLEHGTRLDRNEKVSNFPDEVMADIFGQFRNYSLSASPESEWLYEKIARHHCVDPKQVYITSGITEGVKILYETLTEPDDNVIVLDPTYPMYKVYGELYQLDYRKFLYGDDLAPDPKSLFGQMDRRTRLVVLPNPNLPIESVFSVDEIRKIATKCLEKDIFLVVDEAYHYFGAPTVMDLIAEFENLIVMRTFSKAYGLAAIRLGYMISQDENIGYFSKTRSLVESKTLSMTVAGYFLDHPEWRDQHVKEVSAGAKYLQGELKKMGLHWHGGNVTNGILIFLGNAQQSKDAVQFMRERKIYIRGSFEKPYDACIRVSLGPTVAMAQFAEALKSWKGQKVAA